MSVWSWVIIARKSASTTASTGPAISTGSASTCQSLPPSASIAVTRASPPLQRSRPRSVSWPPPPGWNGDCSSTTAPGRASITRVSSVSVSGWSWQK